MPKSPKQVHSHPSGFSKRTIARTRSLVHELKRLWRVAIAGSAALSLHGIDLQRRLGDIDVAIFGKATPSLVAEALRTTGSIEVEFLTATNGDGRLPIHFHGVKFDLLFPAQMACHAPPFRRDAAERLVADTMASVTMIDELPVIGAAQVLAWKILMSAGESEGKHIADLNRLVRSKIGFHHTT